MPSKKPLGLTPVDQNIINIAFGAGHPLMYAELGFSVSACFNNRVLEKDFWPRFIRACRHGFVTYTDWEELKKHKLAQRVVEAPRGVQAIRDVQILQGGDYNYYRNFNPYIDYEKNPEAMDEFLPGPVNIKGGQRTMAQEQLFQQQLRNHKKNPSKYRWPR